MKPASQQGFTLVELMVTILIGLFLIGGTLTLTSAMKRSYAVQGALNQLEDNERVAFSIMTSVIEQAGYFTNPTQNTVTTALPAITSPSWAAGQAVLGGNNTLSVRYMTSGSDGILNCLGATSATPVTWINTFSLDGKGNLQCTVTTNGVVGTPVTLMTGVTAMSFLFGVAPAGSSSVDTILDQSSAVNFWSNVVSVQVNLTFTNPLYAAAGTTATAGQSNAQPSNAPMSRWVVLMNQVGATS